MTDPYQALGLALLIWGIVILITSAAYEWRRRRRWD